MKNVLNSFLRSSRTVDSAQERTQEIVEWIQQRNNQLVVNITRSNLTDSKSWFLDDGKIVNSSGFFEIRGFSSNINGETIQQPIIIQSEIGYLGIICKEINGILHFLMQAKIEPGNINKIQLSPTIQATKSNFTQKHGGAKPAYLDYFINSQKYEVIVDQIQSEQSSRFYKKRNRNILLRIEEDIVVKENFKWMTLGQIKYLLTIDNLVNMDTRTVLSCIPYSFMKCDSETEVMFVNKEMYRSIFNEQNLLPMVYQTINNYKMFSDISSQFVDLDKLNNWDMTNQEIVCKTQYPFSVIFCDIEIEGREVRRWDQPLFKSNGRATFGLIMTTHEGMKKFLIRCTPEIGCHDIIELGPTVQVEAGHDFNENNVTQLFHQLLKSNQGVYKNVILSEEGGRFYHEENVNVILEVDYIHDVPHGYMWLDYRTLNILNQVNNCLNIQLRNLISLLEV